MQELLQAALSANNIVYTILLIVVLLYWCTVIIGALDLGSFDIDLEVDTDIDIDIDIDIDADVDVASGSWMLEILHFFNFGKVPFMLLFSLITLFAWTGSILINHYLGNGTLFFALAILIPNLFLAMCITKIITKPFLPFFEKMNMEEELVDYIGMTSTLILTATHDKIGQAEVIFNHNPLRINVKTDQPATTIKKGEKALIIDQKENYFIIQKLNTL